MWLLDFTPYNSLRWFGCNGLAVYPFYVVEYTQLEARWTASHGTSPCHLLTAPARERSPRPRPIHVGSGDADMQSVLAAFVEELSEERVELKCVNDLALDTMLRLKLLMRCLHTSHEQFVPGRCFVPYRVAVKHKPHLSPGIELALVAHDGSVLRHNRHLV